MGRELRRHGNEKAPPLEGGGGSVSGGAHKIQSASAGMGLMNRPTPPWVTSRR